MGSLFFIALFKELVALFVVFIILVCVSCLFYFLRWAYIYQYSKTEIPRKPQVEDHRPDLYYRSTLKPAEKIKINWFWFLEDLNRGLFWVTVIWTFLIFFDSSYYNIGYWWTLGFVFLIIPALAESIYTCGGYFDAVYLPTVLLFLLGFLIGVFKVCTYFYHQHF